MQHVLFFIIFTLLSVSFLANPFDTHQSNAKGQPTHHVTLIHESEIQSLAIPAIDLILPVEKSLVANDEWLITDALTAYHGEGTALPGRNGPMVIFAHARPGLFGNLSQLAQGDTILVKGKNNIYVYRVATQEIVSPENVSFLDEIDKHHITLFTCYGPNDEKRILFFGTLEHVISPSQKDDVLYEA